MVLDRVTMTGMAIGGGPVVAEGTFDIPGVLASPAPSSAP